MKIPPYIHATAYSIAVIAFLILGVTTSTYFLFGAAIFALLAAYFWYRVKSGGAAQEETPSYSYQLVKTPSASNNNDKKQ